MKYFINRNHHSENYGGGLYGDVNSAPLLAGDMDGEDMESIAIGAPASEVIAAKTGATPAQAEALAIPGVALEAAVIPALHGVNLEIIQFASKKGVSGSLVKANMELSRSITPTYSRFVNVNGVDPATPVSGTFNTGVLNGEIPMMYTPMIFGVVSASTLNARAGGRYEISITAYNQAGVPSSTEKWLVQRVDVTKPMYFRLIPFVRIKDEVRPIIAVWGDTNETNPDQTLVITVKGLSTGETAQFTAPGIDSEDFRKFASEWNVQV
jgi:hypothetical protein